MNVRSTNTGIPSSSGKAWYRTCTTERVPQYTTVRDVRIVYRGIKGGYIKRRENRGNPAIFGKKIGIQPS